MKYFFITFLLFTLIANFQNIAAMELGNKQQAELDQKLKDILLEINDENYGELPLGREAEDHEKIIQLIKDGANPNKKISFEGNEKNEYSYPLIILASTSSDFGFTFADLIPLFISHGAQVNVVDSTGNTPLIEAVKHNPLYTIEILLKNGANIDATDLKGDTPLIIAVREGKPATIELLLKYGANINIKNKKEKTALTIAVKDSLLDAVSILLDAKNIDAENIKESIERSSRLKQTEIGLLQRNQIEIEKLLMKKLAGSGE